MFFESREQLAQGLDGSFASLRILVRTRGTVRWRPSSGTPPLTIGLVRQRTLRCSAVTLAPTETLSILLLGGVPIMALTRRLAGRLMLLVIWPSRKSVLMTLKRPFLSIESPSLALRRVDCPFMHERFPLVRYIRGMGCC